MSSPVLVGRSSQLAALETALDEVGRGRPSVVMIGGEAGVGKSRLVTEFAARSSAAGGRMLLGGCLELGADGLPFAPFTAVLRTLVRELGAAGVAGLLPGGSTRELARLLPEFGEPAGPDDAGEARARLFEQMLILLEHLAEAGPVVLIVEDMHWADRSTRDLLAFLIRNQASAEGLLIVVTYRSDDMHRTHPLRPLLAELDRIDWVARLDLGRLARQDTAELVAQITGRKPDGDLLAAVYRRTEGNPLFVEALLGDGGTGADLPESLRDLLVASVRRLPEETQDAVRIASAGGERAGHGLLNWPGSSAPAAERRHRPARTARPGLDRAARRQSRPRSGGGAGTARADRPGVRGAAAGGGGAQQPRDRGRTVHLREDRQRARVQHLGQARRDHPRRGRRRRPPAPPVRLASAREPDGP